VVFDYDGDGDQDIYVSNGPGRNNSLYSNQLRETGQLTFIDFAEAAGVGAFEQDSQGVAAGDIDNDGDRDLLVLGEGGPNYLFENNGDGTFTDISFSSGVASDDRTSQSATMGDINGDGLLDIYIANATDFDNQIPIFNPFPPSNQHDQLLLNLGGNTFADVSDSSGITTHGGFPPGFENASSFTHVCAMVDYDLDGDLDIFTGGDQGANATTELGGADNGLLHLFQNDGTGHFVDINESVGLNRVGGWMGITFGDFNHDGQMDFFGSNFGTYAPQNFAVPFAASLYDSRWFLGQADGSFEDPGVGDLVASPFGWGASACDYDNDGDTDIIYHGGLDTGPFIAADNPGVILENDGHAAFAFQDQALAGSTDHGRRNVQGVAVGDLNEDGFADVVSVSNFNYPEPVPLVPFLPLGSPFDEYASLVPLFLPTDEPNVLVLNTFLPPLPDGDLSVEINSGDNGNAWVVVAVQGSKGLIPDGVVNRDGIGAVVSVTPYGGKTAMRPVVAGSSYASQDSLVANFGLGGTWAADVEVLWPGGVRNRLYGVVDGESLVLPEIPVSFDDPNLSFRQYARQVSKALRKLRQAGEVDWYESFRLYISALVAYLEAH
jgi:hypothetical protein